MNVNAATAAGTAPLPTRPASGQEMGKEEFLRLLVTQLSNQDPLNPMDGQQFAAQLAQFTSLEQLININETLGGQGQMNGMLAQSINSGVAAGLLGKTVEADGNHVTWSGKNDVPLGFELGGDAAQIKVTVRDAAGNVVRTIDRKGLDAGYRAIDWDGRDDAGNTLPAGDFSFSVEATDESGKPVEAITQLRGRVDRITFGPEGILLWVGDTAVPLGSVRTVAEET